jgi:hypothetical protein
MVRDIEKIDKLKKDLINKEMDLYKHQQEVFRPAELKRNKLRKSVDDLKRWLYDAIYK